MKFVAFTTLFVVNFCSQAISQTTHVLPFADSLMSLTAEFHLVGQDGGIYLLATKNEFYGVQGTLIEGPYTFGSTVTKTGADGRIVWERFLENNGAAVFQSFRPAWQIFETDSSLFIPFQKYFGYIPCTSTMGYSVARAGVWELRKSDGAFLSRKIFTDDTSCSHQSVQDFIRSADGGYSYFYEQSALASSARTFHVDRRGPSFEAIAREEIPAMFPYPSSGFADYETQEYFLAWRDSVRIYDDLLRWKRSVAMPQTELLDRAFFFKGAVGKDFFVVNAMSVQTDTSYGVTARFRKSGELISIDTTDFFQHLSADERGQIWAVSNQGGFHARADQPQPVSIVQLASSLRPVRRLAFGDTFFFAQTISVSNGDVIVSGSVKRDETQAVPAPPKQPARLFVFRAPTSAVPIVEGDGSVDCSDIVVTPNPTDGAATLHSLDFPAMQGAEVTVTNALGQRMAATRWTGETMNTGLERMAAGVYFVSVSKDSKRCTMRIVKR